MLTKCLAKSAFEELRASVMTDQHVDINNDKYIH